MLGEFGTGHQPDVWEPEGGVGESGTGDVGGREPGLLHKAGGEGVGDARDDDRSAFHCRAEGACRVGSGGPAEARRRFSHWHCD